MMLSLLSQSKEPDIALQNPATAAPPQAVLGQVVTVFSAPGSCGRSLIALNVACELAVAGRQVLLIDADTYAPGLDILLNLTDHPAGLAAACRLASQDRLTADEVRRLSQSLEFANSELQLMVGLSSPARWPEVSAERLEKVIEIARGEFDFVVIDLASSVDQDVRQPVTGALRNQASISALEQANIVLSICGADPVSIQRHMLAIQHLAELQLSAEVLTVVNRLRASAIGANPKQQIGETLSRFANVEVSAFVPDDPVHIDRAILESTPLVLTSRKSAARTAISNLVRQQILGETSPLDRRLAKLA